MNELFGFLFFVGIILIGVAIPYWIIFNMSEKDLAKYEKKLKSLMKEVNE